MKKVFFLDRDGTLIKEPEDEQIDSLEKLEFYPGVFRVLHQLKAFFPDYLFVIISNQDGLGTDAYPQATYDLVQGKMIQAFENEGIEFDEVLIDKSKPEDASPNRKPATGMLKKYLEGDFDLKNSYVIGDRITDVELAKNIGSKAILLACDSLWNKVEKQGLKESCLAITPDWDIVFSILVKEERTARIQRNTKETNILIELDLDGNGSADISTGLGFFDHMLEQIGKHSGMNLKIKVDGDLNVDEHHTMEDTAIVLGEAVYKALGSKRGIERYGFVLPMDDNIVQVAIDFGGRPWLVWDTEFKREMIGDTPTEMYMHFFKSFSDAAKCNLNIKAEGVNEHHKIEGIFKAFAKAIKMAVKRNVFDNSLPSTKGYLE